MNSRTREPAAKAPLSARQQGAGRDDGPARRICIGVVTGPQGVKGAVRIKSFTEVPEDIARYGPVEDETGRRQFDLRLCGFAKGVLIVHLPGIEDRDQAEALRGLRLYLCRSALPQPEVEEYYHADLIGLDAILEDGTRVGRVRAIYDFGAGDTLELVRDGRPPVLVPFTRAVVPIVAPAEGRLVLDPPPGLLGEDEP
jgi:16S rRNA processing protein RimM